MNHSFDPQWLPSDADLVNWLEEKRASVSMGQHGWLCIVPIKLNEQGEAVGLRVVGPRLKAREVLEQAMRENP